MLCYDGHATASPAESWRKVVAKQASGNYASYLEQLHAEGGDLYDPATLIRNGPGSANYRTGPARPEINEISPGSAFVYAGYLRAGFDTQGLASALMQAAPVLKDVGPYPSTLFTKEPLPPIIGEEYFLIGSTWPDQAGIQPAFVYPRGVQDDQREGGRCMVYAPPGELTTSDYVLCWPNQGGDGIDYFGALHAVRAGTRPRRMADVHAAGARPGPPEPTTLSYKRGTGGSVTDGGRAACPARRRRVPRSLAHGARSAAASRPNPAIARSTLGAAPFA